MLLSLLCELEGGRLVGSREPLRCYQYCPLNLLTWKSQSQLAPPRKASMLL
jgi:hypothetical protein